MSWRARFYVDVVRPRTVLPARYFYDIIIISFSSTAARANIHQYNYNARVYTLCPYTFYLFVSNI